MLLLLSLLLLLIFALIACIGCMVLIINNDCFKIYRIANVNKKMELANSNESINKLSYTIIKDVLLSENNNSNKNNNNSNNLITISDAFKSVNSNCASNRNMHLETTMLCNVYSPILIIPALPPLNLNYDVLNYCPKYNDIIL